MDDSQLLAPWEYEGEVPQIIEAGELLYKGRLVQYELLRGDRTLDQIVFRPEGEEGSWSMPWLTQRMVRGRTRAYVVHRLKRGDFVRQFRFDEERMRISPCGVGYWHSDPPGVPSDSWGFCLGKCIAGQTSSQTYDWVARLLARPASDVSFARRFYRASESKKWMQLWGLNNEEELSTVHAQLEDLCVRVLYAHADLWKWESQIDWMLINSLPEKETTFQIFHSSHETWPESLSARLNAWAEVTKRFGLPTFRVHRVCLEQFATQRTLLAKGHLTAPSAHQHLEARLQLREWMCQHVPSREWAELERFED